MTDFSDAQVLVSYGSHGIVETQTGQRHDCKFRRAVGRPVCGDIVKVKPADDESLVVEAIESRRNEFARADQRGRRHVAAANLDRVIVVLASQPAPSRDLLDRYLVAIASLNIKPVIVINKTDLASDEPVPVFARLADYEQLGYPVLKTSCENGSGLEQLAQLVSSGTSILVGQSGVGKSSLVHELLPDIEVQTGELSTVTGKGTHTTTTTMMYALPFGGQLIDSPGVWEFGLWKLEPLEVGHGFPEFLPHLGLCKFNDCLHISEPGCAIKEAVNRGQILPWRYQSYQRLLQQNNDA